jgi:ubiquinol-cytochrome c reductase cytochrome c1 subunit
MIADVEVVDGPNDQGEMFERPAKISDGLPKPYANDEAARAGNNGALPPDLSLISKARHGGPDYIFALLTGYVDPPEGRELLEGLHYNPYFPGAAIAMEKQLNDGQVEYEDGTEATASQMAKDVSVFLAWASEPEHDTRKKMGLQWIGGLIIMAALTGYYKRLRWAPLKTRKISYTK